jgi:hypothetical protein
MVAGGFGSYLSRRGFMAGTTGVNIVGGDGASMAIAAPGSGVHIVGGSYFGTVLGKTVVLKGNLTFHEDLH